VETKKPLYREGDWFAVPLKDNGLAVGLIARAAPRSNVLFGYFFGPQRQIVPDIEDVQGYNRDDAILVERFGDLSLRQGGWPVIGRVEPWDRARWPMPAFGRRVSGHDLAYRVEYPDDDPNGLPCETRITVEECERLPAAGLDGARAVEITLAQLLHIPADDILPNMPPTTQGQLMIDYFLYLPAQAQAHTMAGRLEAEGYTVEVRDPGDTGEEWLVRAKHDSPATEAELDAVEAHMEAMATAVGGSYDGYERDVPR